MDDKRDCHSRIGVPMADGLVVDYDGGRPMTAIDACSNRGIEEIAPDSLVANCLLPSTNLRAQHALDCGGTKVGGQWNTTGGCTVLFSGSAQMTMDTGAPSGTQRGSGEVGLQIHVTISARPETVIGRHIFADEACGMVCCPSGFAVDHGRSQTGLEPLDEGS
jgi:hypothetical protein